jgi:hypothetical protein
MWLFSFALFVGASGSRAIQATLKPLQIAASLYGAVQDAPENEAVLGFAMAPVLPAGP